MTNRATKAVSEFEVLLHTAVWLVKSSAIQKIEISLPKGQAMPQEDQRNQLLKTLEQAGCKVVPTFTSSGPDITAWEETRVWRVECKGLTGGDRTTVDNNFDRALASVVGYYDEPNANRESDLRGIRGIMESFSSPDRPIRLMLALPEGDRYRKLLKKCVKKCLRRKLDLWVLIVNSATESVKVYEPDQEL